MERERAGRGEYRHFTRLTTRWADNDAYGHLNNVVYYSLFDSAVNAALIDAGLLDVERSAVVGLVAETGCRYFAALAFPDAVEAGLRVARIGRSSVRYEIAIFKAGRARSGGAGAFRPRLCRSRDAAAGRAAGAMCGASSRRWRARLYRSRPRCVLMV